MVKDKNEFQKLLLDVYSVLNAKYEDGHDEKIREVLKLSGEYFKVDRVSGVEFSQCGEEITNVYIYCRDEKFLDNYIPCNECLDKTPWLINQIKAQKEVGFNRIGSLKNNRSVVKSEVDVFQEGKIKSLYCVPLLVDNNVIGFLSFEHIKEEVEFNEEEKAIARIISNLTAYAINKKRLEEYIAYKEKVLESAMHTKTRFLANINHEIRTPLNGLIGFIQLFELDGATKEQKEYIQNIRGSANELLEVVNNILDISNSQNNKLELREEEFDFKRILEDTILSFQKRIENKGIQLKWDIEESIPSTLIGDEDRVAQIVANLMSNSIKFTDNGCIHVLAKSIQMKGELQGVQIEVKDTGIGMSEDDVKYIFAPFMQVDDSATRKHGGSGLGLAICNKIAEQMEGDIKVKSKLGVGSEFKVRIYLPLAYDDIKTETVTEINLKNSKEGKVLIVEDDELNIKFLSSMLTVMDIKFDVAMNGKEAISFWKQNRYDLIFMDCQMPVMDGYIATKKIRELEEVPKTIIVGITANAFYGDEEKCLNAGMDDYISKPIDIHRVEAVLAQHIDNWSWNK